MSCDSISFKELDAIRNFSQNGFALFSEYPTISDLLSFKFCTKLGNRFLKNAFG